MRNPRILFVAPRSYPLWGAEANVNAKVIRLLTNAGCIVDLVARPSRNEGPIYPPSADDFFFGKLNSLHLVRVNTRYDLKTLLRHLAVLFKTGYVFRGCDWAVDAIKVCERLVAQYTYDFIYTYDYPSEIVGAYMSKKYKLKWVATWNDPYMWKKYPAPYGKGADVKVSSFRRKLIRHIGKLTYRNVFPSARLRDYMLKYMENMRRESCIILPHIVLNELKVKNQKSQGDTLSIIHAGVFGKERDPETFLQALRRFLDNRKDAQIKFAFLGIFEKGKGSHLDDLIHKYEVSEYITFIPPVSYKESLEIIRQYDVCMIIEAPCEEGIFLPSKVADYLQNNKPILTLSPQHGVLKDMYEQKLIDYFADVRNVSDITAQLERLYTDFLKHTLGISKKDCSYYENENILAIQKSCLFSSLV